MADSDEGRQVDPHYAALSKDLREHTDDIVKPPCAFCIAVQSFFVMGVVQFVSYLNLTINFRAIAHEQYTVVAFTDALAVAISYFIIRRVSSQDNKAALAGMVIGGSAAGVLGIWLTRVW